MGPVAPQGRAGRSQQRRRHLLPAAHHLLQLLAHADQPLARDHELGCCGYRRCVVVLGRILYCVREEELHGPDC